ncbi:DUF1829 domain-containing protein [Lachnospiraceae bacterium]|nr:DUF1829 domain-containing protein [Lachnospiraceae bacterium]
MNNNFKESYIKWLYENIDEYRISKNVFRLTLPYLDRNNDCIEIFIKIDGDSCTLTDDGETINELELSNFNIFSSQRRIDIFNQILKSHGVSRSDKNELFVMCSESDLPQRKHMLSQCMIKVSDLFYTSRNTIQSLFIEDVQSYLDSADIRYTPNISFPGKSSLITNYDFVIPRSKQAPERILKVVNNIDQTQTNSILFLWDDTKQEREPNSLLYVFMQDKDKKISPNIITAMNNYNVKPVRWSERQQYLTELEK